MRSFLPSDEFSVFCLIAVGLLGLCLGSFATALIYRIPRDIPWIWNKNGKASRSECPSCHASLRFLDLVPFFSWVFSKGRCRHCSAKISATYPLTELLCFLLVMALYAAWGNTMAVIPVLLLTPFLITIIVIDWQHMIIPDDMNIAVFVLGLLFVFTQGPAWPFYLAAGLILPAIFWLVSFVLEKWRGRQALGMGDVKFLAGAGLFLGIEALPSYLFFSGLFGLLTALYGRFSGKKGAFPFGPALVLALLLHLFLTGIGFDGTGGLLTMRMERITL